jgi:hypothetical protein
VRGSMGRVISWIAESRRYAHLRSGALLCFLARRTKERKRLNAEFAEITEDTEKSEEKLPV